jgi:hypothetical protein
MGVVKLQSETPSDFSGALAIGKHLVLLIIKKSM